MATSQNGYTANDPTRTQSWLITGTERKVRLRKGSPGALLVHFAAWFDKNIESVDGGILDDWGYAERPIRGSSTTLSNHASGTALDLNAPRHPLGARNTFTDAQEKKIRAQLKVYEGCIRWGGDYKNRPDEMHFEIDKDVATCDRVLAKLSKPAPAKPITTPKPPAQEGELTMAQLDDIMAKLNKIDSDATARYTDLANRVQAVLNEERARYGDYVKRFDSVLASAAAEDKLDDAAVAELRSVLGEVKTAVEALPTEPPKA